MGLDDLGYPLQPEPSSWQDTGHGLRPRDALSQRLQGHDQAGGRGWKGGPAADEQGWLQREYQK